jgi:hypothetical protein
MRQLFLAAGVLGFLIGMGSMAWGRKWTSSDGKFSTEAEFIEYAEGKVTLKKDTGETISVPIAKLSSADRRFVIAAKKVPKTPPKAEPSYAKDIQPFLTTYCAECHNQKRAKAGYAVDTLAALTENGKKGPLVVPGKPGESLMLQLFQQGPKHMPPDSSTQPKSNEIAKVTAWIEAGAREETGEPAQENVSPKKKRSRT